MYCQLVAGNYFDKVVKVRYFLPGVNVVKTSPPPVPVGKFAQWTSVGWKITDIAPSIKSRAVYKKFMTRKEFLSLFTPKQRRKIKNKIEGKLLNPADDKMLHYWELLIEGNSVNFNDPIIVRSMEYLKTAKIFNVEEFKKFKIGYPYKRVR